MILVYVDCMGSEDEIPKIKKYLNKYGLAAKVTDDPNWDHKDVLSKYSHIFVDFGGLDMPGIDLFEHFCARLDYAIENHPSVEFVFMSTFGKEYYSNFMDQTNKPNVTFMEAFFDDNEFAKILSIEPIPIKVNKLITPNRRTS